MEFPCLWVKLSPMQLGYEKMGCGRSKHEQSQKNSSQEDINMPQKTGRKKKLKGQYLISDGYIFRGSNFQI